jgi:hypothetical protein
MSNHTDVIAAKRREKNGTETPETAAVATVIPDLTQRNELIATSAYFRAERRGFEPGHELEDWLASEEEVVKALGEFRAISREAGNTF